MASFFISPGIQIVVWRSDKRNNVGRGYAPALQVGKLSEKLGAKFNVFRPKPHSSISLVRRRGHNRALRWHM